MFDVLPARMRSLGKNAVVFASPPWGGELPFRDLWSKYRAN